MLALRELLHNLKDRDWDVNPTYKIDENEAKKIIKAIEEVESGGKWILCSKRLPEEAGEYLATIYDMNENHEYIDIAKLEDGKWCYKSYILVKAWMPLPEPMKVGE